MGVVVDIWMYDDWAIMKDDRSDNKKRNDNNNNNNHYHNKQRNKLPSFYTQFTFRHLLYNYWPFFVNDLSECLLLRGNLWLPLASL